MLGAESAATFDRVADGEQIELTAIAFSTLVQARELAWEPPMRELMQKPESADFVWRRVQYAFSLEDPRRFPKVEVDWSPDDKARLRRYVEHGMTLAQTSLLGAGDNIRITQADFASPEQVEADLSPPDVTVGFMALLRQCYANDEDASFVKVRKALGKHLHAASLLEELSVVREWQHVHNGLLNKSLEEHVQERLREEGEIPGPLEGPDSMIVRDFAPPHELLRAFWYGDQIHWGRQRAALASLQRDPFRAALSDLQSRAVALDLAHLYIGFAVLVERALG